MFIHDNDRKVRVGNGHAGLLGVCHTRWHFRNDGSMGREAKESANVAAQHGSLCIIHCRRLLGSIQRFKDCERGMADYVLNPLQLCLRPTRTERNVLHPSPAKY